MIKILRCQSSVRCRRHRRSGFLHRQHRGCWLRHYRNNSKFGYSKMTRDGWTNELKLLEPHFISKIKQRSTKARLEPRTVGYTYDHRIVLWLLETGATDHKYFAKD